MPNLEKTKTAILADGIDIKDLSEIPDENVVAMKIPKGFMSGMQSWPLDDVLYYWVFEKPEQAALLQGGGDIPLFDIVSHGRDAIDSIFKKPGSKGLIGAMKFLVRDDILYIDFVSIKNGWRRRGLASMLVKMAKDAFPDKKVAFSPTTQLGGKFVEGTALGPVMKLDPGGLKPTVVKRETL